MEPDLPAKATVGPEKEKPDLNNENGKQYPGKDNPKVSHISSISSSSSSSLSLEFSIDERESPYEIFKFDGDTLSGPEREPVSSPDSTPDKMPSWSMLSASSVQNPPGHPAGYDPDRIPASIFSPKAANPSDWSAASNESLFSIHMGNSSFSQDNMILFGKSGELGRVDDWNGPQSGFRNVSEPKAKSNESSGLPPVIEVSAHEEGSSLASGEVSRVGSFNCTSVENRGKEKAAPDVGPDFKRARPAENNKLTNSTSTPRTSASNPRLSDESGNSGSSFAFPVLVNEDVKIGSLRRVADITEKPQLQAQVSKPTHKAPERRCFSRLCCWPRCC